jgi:3-hydroxyisobutyrate dehydrogenase-like beta-hydroxyacid dehydrogenase
VHSVGFIGLGVMGAPIARRLVGAGYALTVYDVRPSATESFRETAAVAARAADCATADIIFLLVATDEQLQEVVLGPGGLWDAIDPSTPPIVVAMGTSLPDTIRALGDRLAEKHAGLLDAPISGGRDGAESGALSVMVGGARGDFDAAHGILKAVGRNVTYCGDLGSGATTKILNNLIGVTNWLMMAETMALGSRLGMDLDNVTAVMELGTGRNIATRSWSSRRASYATYAEDAALFAANNQICRKDLGLALKLARELGLDLPITAGLARVLESVVPAELQSVWAEIGC